MSNLSKPHREYPAGGRMQERADEAASLDSGQCLTCHSR